MISHSISSTASQMQLNLLTWSSACKRQGTASNTTAWKLHQSTYISINGNSPNIQLKHHLQKLVWHNHSLRLSTKIQISAHQIQGTQRDQPMVVSRSMQYRWRVQVWVRNHETRRWFILIPQWLWSCSQRAEVVLRMQTHTLNRTQPNDYLCNNCAIISVKMMTGYV